MATGDERRRAARELRGLRRNGHNVTQRNHGLMWSVAWCVLGDELSACVPGDWFERMCARLADLIEPGCDRKSLLTLANLLSDIGAGFVIDREGARDVARQIREACGEAANGLPTERPGDVPPRAEKRQDGDAASGGAEGVSHEKN